MGLSGIFSTPAKMGRSLAMLAVPFALSACASAPLVTGPCMEGTSVTGPANLVSARHVAYNETCGNTMMNRTLIQVGNERNDVGLVMTGVIAQGMENQNLAQATEMSRQVILNPNGTILCTAGTPTPGSRNVPLTCAAPIVTAPAPTTP